MKSSKQEAGYTTEAEFCIGNCRQCVYFFQRNCDLVKGDIDPEGWCSWIQLRKERGQDELPRLEVI